MSRRAMRCSAAVLAILAAGVAPSIAAAAEVPTASRFDSRIRTVIYNPEDVVTVATAAGSATTVRFEDGETYVNHVFGDAAAWSFAEVSQGFAVKPVAERADTNLTVFTDRRVYVFELKYLAAKDAQSLFLVTFKYPETAKAVNVEVAQKASIEKAFAAPPTKANLSYTMSGDKSLAPVNVWDDGTFTFFKFRPNQDLPSIYMVDADGEESIVNRHTADVGNDVVVLQKVNTKWRLRLGKQVLVIFNNDMEARPIATAPARQEPETGTASPLVERVIKGAAQ